MAVDTAPMGLKDMGFASDGKLSEGQGIAGVAQFAKTLEKGNLGRLEASEYKGGVGFVDNLARGVKALVGQDTVSREVREFTGWVKKEGAEKYQSHTEAFLELDGQVQLDRMSGGNADIKDALKTLFDAHQRSQDGDVAQFKDRLGDVWKQANEWMNGRDVDGIGDDGTFQTTHEDGQYDAHKKMIDEYMEGAEHAKTETFNSLWEMWDLQDRKDLVNRTANYVNSSDHNRAVSPSGERGSKRQPLEGGLIRRAVAWVKGLPKEIGERGNAVLSVEGVSEARELAIRGGLSELKHDALNRAPSGSLERAEMFVKGIITEKELGASGQLSEKLDELVQREQAKVANGEKKDTRLLKRIEKYRETGKVTKARDGAAVAFYEDFYTPREAEAHKVFDDAKAEWAKYSLKMEGGFAAGLMPAPLTEVAMKLSAFGVDGTLSVARGVDGTVGLAIESMDTVMADWALGRMAEATVGRELAAAEHKKSATIYENVDPKESAKLIRGAEAVWQRSALMAGRTADTLEFSRTSPAVLHVPGALIVEGTDLALGGVSVGERSGKIMDSLYARNEQLLSAKTLIARERANIRGEEYRVAQKVVDQEVAEIFSGLPEQYENWEKMKGWMDQRVLGFEVTTKDVADMAKGILSTTKYTRWLSELVEVDGNGTTLVKFDGFAYRKRVLEAVGKWTDPDKMKTELGKILNKGSERRTKAEVLGLEKHEGGRINRSERQVRLQDQLVIVNKKLSEGTEMLKSREVTQPEGYDSILEHATLTELSAAQKRWLNIQKDRMVRRSKLDSMWEGVPKAAGAAAGAVGGVFAFQFLGNHFHDVVKTLGIDLGEAKGQLQYAQEALNAAGDADVFADPNYAETHQSWAQQAGEANVRAAGWQVESLGREVVKATGRQISSYLMAFGSGITSLAATGYTAVRLLGGAATPFVGGKVARMTGFVEDQPNIQ